MVRARRLAASSFAFAAALGCIAPALPAASAADTTPANAVEEWADARDDRLMYWIDRAGLPDEVSEGLKDLRGLNERFVVNLPWGDMTRDGLRDVLGVEFDFGPGGIGLDGTTTTLTALSGRTGRTLWTRSFEEDMAWPIPVRLGPKGRAGALMVSFDYTEDATTFVAIDSRGREAYAHTLRCVQHVRRRMVDRA